MKRERRTLSVPSINFPDEVSDSSITMDSGGLLGMSPQQGSGGNAGRPPQQPLSPSSLGPSFSRSRSASISALSTPTGPTPSPSGAAKKKGVIACQRCRNRKIRCDNALPSCQGCVKACVPCIEVDRAGGDNVPRSHVLELENRVKWLEDIVRGRCPDVDLSTGPTAELRSRPAPPAIRIVTTGPDMHPPQSSMSSTSSPAFALSPASTCATPASFEFSPSVSPGYLAPYSPYTFSDGGSPSPSPAPSSPLLPSPVLPLRDLDSQNQGLISVLAIEEPKYIGSSSGISLLRLVFQGASEPDFRPIMCGQSGEESGFGSSTRWPGLNAKPATLPKLEECRVLSGHYFTTVSLEYPFLYRPQFEACLEAVHSEASGAPPQGYTMAVARFHVFLVLSISAAILSSRSGHSMDSESYFASAMCCVDEITLMGSVQAAQSALLLAMHSLNSPTGLNIWYLKAVIMATCIDIGLQRKIISLPGQGQSAIKRRVFWSAYALDRNLGISLGRPFSLGDEAFDVDFPGEADNDEELAHINSFPIGAGLSPNCATARASFSGAIYLFRMAEVLSDIKTTIYGVTQPSDGKSQADLLEWQAGIYRQLARLREQAQAALGASRRGSGSGGIYLGSGQMIELKFYEAIQLLFQPSPAFPHLTPPRIRQCFTAAIETIRIYAKLQRYGELQYTWLTANSIYLSGISMLHMYTKGEQMQAPNEVLIEEIKSCSLLLESLATRWPMARVSKNRFDVQAQSVLLTNSSSSRMLSPHNGPRRSSSSSPHGRMLPELHSQTLEVPGMTHRATQQSHTQLESNWSDWCSEGTVGGAAMDTSWAGGNWSMATNPLVSGGEARLEGMDPLDENLYRYLDTGSGGDTSMWDMEQGGI